jgi:hypothetical protein
MDWEKNSPQRKYSFFRSGIFGIMPFMLESLDASGNSQFRQFFVLRVQMWYGFFRYFVFGVCLIPNVGHSAAFIMPNWGFVPIFDNLSSRELESNKAIEPENLPKSALNKSEIEPETLGNKQVSLHEAIAQLLAVGDLKSAQTAIDDLKLTKSNSEPEQVEFDRLRLRFYDMAAEAVLKLDGSVLPSSSDIRIDGIKVANQFPITIRGYGKHVITFSHEGYEPFEKTIEVNASSGMISIGSVNLIRRYTLKNPEDLKPLGESEESIKESQANQEAMKLALESAVENWRICWESGDSTTLGNLYSSAFIGSIFSTKTGWKKYGRSQWIKDRSRKIARNKKTLISVENLQIATQIGNDISVSFDQSFKSGPFVECGFKTIVFRKTSTDTYLIVKENFMPAKSLSSANLKGMPIESYQTFVENWRQACESKNINEFTKFYAYGFLAKNQNASGVTVTNRKTWLREKKSEFMSDSLLLVQLDDMLFFDDSEIPGAKLVVFRQTSRVGEKAESGNKILRVITDRSGRMWIAMEFFCPT